MTDIPTNDETVRITEAEATEIFNDAHQRAAQAIQEGLKKHGLHFANLVITGVIFSNNKVGDNKHEFALTSSCGKEHTQALLMNALMAVQTVQHRRFVGGQGMTPQEIPMDDLEN